MQRGRAHRRAGIGEDIEQEVEHTGRPHGADRADRLQPHVGLGAGGLDQLHERGRGGGIADAPQRANRLDQHGTVGGRHEREQHPQRGAILQRAEPLDRERARVRVWIPRQRDQRVQGARVREPLQRVRHGPPSHARLAGRVQHGRGERLVRLQPHERVHAEAEGGGRRVAPRVLGVGRRLRQRAGLNDLRDEAAHRVGCRDVSNETKRLGRAPLHERRRIGERGDERVAGARIAEQAEGERGNLPHFGVCVGHERDQRLHALAQADAPDCQRRAAAHARLIVRQQPHEIRQQSRRAGYRVAEHTVVLQPENPGHLLFEGCLWRRRRRRKGRCGCACGGEREGQREKRAHRTDLDERGHGPMISSGRLPFRYLAIEGPIGAGKTQLAERLGTRLDAALVLEETDNPFLADFYADRPGAALQAQLFYLLNRHRQQTTLRQADLFSQVTISDYLFDKDKIFAYLNLDDNELFIYQRLYDLLARDVPAPDLVVYLQAPTDVLLRRVHSRRMDAEAVALQPDDDYLRELNEAYHHFFFHYNATPLLVVETSQFDSAASDEALDDLIRQVRGMGPGTRYYVPRTK